MSGARSLSQRLARAEPWIVWVLGALCMAAVPVSLGGIGLSWDALNHHIYLGWVAGHPRFDRDIAAASYQAYQFPYLYWPAYRLAMANVSGATAGVVLALLQSLAIPPAWIVARACCPGDDWVERTLRLLAVFLAFIGGVTLSLLDSTSNDMFAAIPLLWAIALAFLAAEVPQGDERRRMWWCVLSGLCAGIAVACKLSNGPLVLLLPLAWFMTSGTLSRRFLRVIAAGVATLVGFIAAYGWWGWQLWLHMGNPFYPFYDVWFERLRLMTGWAG